MVYYPMDTPYTINREPSALVKSRSTGYEAGIAGHLLEELDGFKHEVEHLHKMQWKEKHHGS
jgi:hypothetical protein